MKFSSLFYGICILIFSTNIARAAKELASVVQPAEQLSARYSVSFASVETAHQAVNDVTQTKDVVNARDLEQRRACYQKFFVNYCLDQAKTQYRLAMKQVNAIDMDAHAYLRKEDAQERDRALQIKADQQPAEAAEKAKNQQEKDRENAEKVKQAATKAAEVDHHTQTTEVAPARNQKMDQNITEEQRAANIAQFERKSQESAARVRKIEEEKAAKALARKKKVESSTP